jgi:hypothetical protein
VPKPRLEPYSCSLLGWSPSCVAGAEADARCLQGSDVVGSRKLQNDDAPWRSGYVFCSCCVLLNKLRSLHSASYVIVEQSLSECMNQTVQDVLYFHCDLHGLFLFLGDYYYGI